MEYGAYAAGDSSIHDLLVCPYNPSHRVGASKFPNHLVRCRRQNPELAAEIGICNYNQSHHVWNRDMSYHLTICPEYQAHQLHSINTGAPKYLPEDLHKHVANSAKPKLQDTTSDKNAPLPPIRYTQAELDEWM